MKNCRSLHLVGCTLLAMAPFSAAFAQTSFFGDPPNEYYPWVVHDHNRPQPAVVQPGAKIGDPPSDAIVLFDGTEASFENWVHDRPKDKRKQDWVLKDGALVSMAGAGYIVSKEHFGDCQLHIEWKAPYPVQGLGQGRGNSGVFLMGMVEVQILDNYQNPTYPDGTAGAVYGVMPPAVNALRPSKEWQSYDIIYRRPIVRDGVILDQGSLTVLVNGVVVQDSTPLEGGGGFRFRKPWDRVFPDEGPLKLQDHGNPVSFRNIWYRPLRPRALDGGFDGRLTPAVSMEKRAAIAEEIREDALTRDGTKRMLRLLESLVYVDDEATRELAESAVDAYVAELESAQGGALESMKGSALDLDRALQYMTKHGLIAADFPATKTVDRIAVERGWKNSNR